MDLACSLFRSLSSFLAGGVVFDLDLAWLRSSIALRASVILRGLSNSVLELCVRARVSCQFLAQFSVQLFRITRQRQRVVRALKDASGIFATSF